MTEVVLRVQPEEAILASVRLILLLCAIVLAAPRRAGAELFAVPLTPPPHAPQAVASEKEWRLWGAYASARAPGLSLDGAGGGLGLSGQLQGPWRLDLHAEGYILSGKADPGSGLGRVNASMGSGGLGFGVARESGGAWLRLGAQIQMSSLQFSQRAVTVSGSRTSSLTPDAAMALTLSLPAAAGCSRPLGDKWLFSPSAGLSLYAAGAEFYLYLRRGPQSPEWAKTMHPFLAATASATLLYKPWGLSVEGGFLQTSGSGNNRPTAVTTGQLVWRLP